MKKYPFFLFLMAIGFSFFSHVSAKGKRVVMIALDGISVAGYEKAHTPNLDALMAEGAFSTTTRVAMPSVTLPNWTSHLTGSGPELHGVVNNSWKIDKFVLPPVAKDAEGYYPSVFTILKEKVRKVKTAFYYNWKPLFNPHNEKNFDETSYLEKDEYIPNYRKALDFIFANKNKPTVVFLYSVHTDHAGHKHKWMSSQYIKSIEEADVEIGKFLNELKEGGLYKDTYFMFLSDHGGKNYGHGGVMVDEMIVPWGITGPKIKKGFIIEEPNNTVNTASVVLRLFKVKQPLSWVGEVPKSIFR